MNEKSDTHIETGPPAKRVGLVARLATVACVALATLTLVGATPAGALGPSITAQCGTNVMDLSTPAAGQTWVYVKIWRWSGSEWQLIHTELQRTYNTEYIVLDVLRPVQLPSGYVTARVYGWYGNVGWIQLDTPLFRNGAGPLQTPYCRV